MESFQLLIATLCGTDLFPLFYIQEGRGSETFASLLVAGQQGFEPWLLTVEPFPLTQ